MSKQPYSNATDGQAVTACAPAGRLTCEIVKLLLVFGGLSLLLGGALAPSERVGAAAAIDGAHSGAGAGAPGWQARDAGPHAPEPFDESVGAAVFISPYLQLRHQNASAIRPSASEDPRAGSVVVHLRRTPPSDDRGTSDRDNDDDDPGRDSAVVAAPIAAVNQGLGFTLAHIQSRSWCSRAVDAQAVRGPPLSGNREPFGVSIVPALRSNCSGESIRGTESISSKTEDEADDDDDDDDDDDGHLDVTEHAPCAAVTRFDMWRLLANAPINSHDTHSLSLRAPPL